MVKQRKWHRICLEFRGVLGGEQDLHVNNVHLTKFHTWGVGYVFYFRKERGTLPNSNNFDFHLLSYNQSNYSSELSVKNVPKHCPWTGSWKLTLYYKSFYCSIFCEWKKGTVFLLLTPTVAAVRVKGGGGGHGRWSRQMLTLKPCGISDMSPGYVNTCNYLIQQVLSLQLRTGCSSSWIRFRIVIPESCLIY